MAKFEREKVVPFEFDTELSDIGKLNFPLLLKRRTPEIDTRIAQAKAQLLGGLNATSPEDNLWMTAVATLSNAVEPQGLTDPNWIENVLGCREAVFAVYNKWLEYQNSFRKRAVDADNTTTIR
jgi:hypothetical protein